MPPKVSYWTGTWDPQKEAISKEVNALRAGARAQAPVVSFAPGQPIRLNRRERVLTLPASAWLLLRGVAAIVEPRADVTHVFGGSVSWHFLRSLGRRPILLTAVVPGPPDSGLTLGKLAYVAVEAEALADDWVRLGVPRDRVVLVHPGIDLDRYVPLPPPAQSRFQLLFASTPADASEFAARGLDLLIELARRRPDIDVVVPWRKWGDLESSRRALADRRPPENFRVSFENVPDMRTQYAGAHATIVCFERGSGKAAPNFVLEGLAGGRPCICTEESAISADIDRGRAGVVTTRTVAGLSEGVDRIRYDLPGFSTRARALAEHQFDLRRFRARYDELYEKAAGATR